jgi:hypothetical protein
MSCWKAVLIVMPFPHVEGVWSKGWVFQEVCQLLLACFVPAMPWAVHKWRAMPSAGSVLRE